MTVTSNRTLTQSLLYSLAQSSPPCDYLGTSKNWSTVCKVNIRRSGVGYYLRGEETGPVGVCFVALNVYLYIV